MKFFLQLWLVALMACNLAACGTKGKLKTPTQIHNAEVKKAKKDAKNKGEATDDDASEKPDASKPAPDTAKPEPAAEQQVAPLPEELPMEESPEETK